MTFKKLSLTISLRTYVRYFQLPKNSNFDYSITLHFLWLKCYHGWYFFRRFICYGCGIDLRHIALRSVVIGTN